MQGSRACHVDRGPLKTRWRSKSTARARPSTKYAIGPTLLSTSPTTAKHIDAQNEPKQRRVHPATPTRAPETFHAHIGSRAATTPDPSDTKRYATAVRNRPGGIFKQPLDFQRKRGANLGSKRAATYGALPPKQLKANSAPAPET